MNQIRAWIGERPDGITLQKVEPSGNGADLVLRSDDSIKPGFEGNLVMEVFMKSANAAKNNQPGTAVGTLPAIPIQVVAK